MELLKTFFLFITLHGTLGYGSVGEDNKDTEIARLKKEVHDLKVNLQHVTALLTDVETVLGERLWKLEENVRKVEKSNKQHEEDISTVRFMNSQNVAFFASVSKTTELQDGQAVIFDKIRTNYGSAYTDICGSFKAPIRGLYFFTLNFLNGAHPNPTTNLDIKVNDERVCVAYADGDHRHTTGTCSVLVELQAGDVVHVEHEDPHGDGGVIWNSPYTGFSGYLYKPL